jgi:hypothetical protein
MATHDKQLAHLERLAEALSGHGCSAELVRKSASPYLRVANAQTPTLNERVLCYQAGDGSWVFWWPWKQPIGSVDDLETVARKLAAVLRSVERDQAQPGAMTRDDT